MMIRTQNGYLDYDGDIEIERQVLLFEDLEETRGDFSYSFSVPRTENNMAILDIPLPDNASKIVYRKVDAEIISDSGSVLYNGFIIIEGLGKTEIPLSFFSGNSNWLSLLVGDMTQLSLSEYDLDLNTTEIVNRRNDTSGIVFPVIDTGVLATRSFENLQVEDFVGCFYLHTLFMEVFKQSGLKLKGDLINDPVFNQIVVATNTRSKLDIDANSLFVGKTDNQIIPTGLSLHFVTFNEQTTPYFIGDQSTFTSDIYYYASSDMLVDIDVSWQSTVAIIGGLRNSTGPILQIPGVSSSKQGTNELISIRSYKIAAGDFIALRVFNDQASPSTITYASLRVTPTFIYKAFGRSCVPLWTKLEFVNNVLALFNTITDYDPYTKTVTIDLFEKIHTQSPLDISPYCVVNDIDYVSFISNYGKRTTLKYDAGDDEDLTNYNISSFIKYGEGVIEVDNELLPNTAPLLESDFRTPLSYINSVFNASLERINFVEYVEVETTDLTSVTDDGGIPQFNVDEDIFLEGDVVRIESAETQYNGEYIVGDIGSGFIKVQGLAYVANSTGTVTLLKHKVVNDDSVYLFINVPDYDVDQMSPTKTGWYLNTVFRQSYNVAFFSLLYTGTPINDAYKQSLSFGSITNPSFYQRTLIDTYWQTTKRVLNDPVLIPVEATMPEVIFNSLTPLRPVFLKTEETVNLYYVNKVSGYVSSFKPCEIELIKLP